MAAPFRELQKGSEYVRFTRFLAKGSIHCGSIAAAVRAKSLDVSTSSAAMTHAGVRLLSPEPGQITKWAPRAPS